MVTKYIGKGIKKGVELSIEEAKKRWGKAGVHKGGKQGKRVKKYGFKKPTDKEKATVKLSKSDNVIKVKTFRQAENKTKKRALRYPETKAEKAEYAEAQKQIEWSKTKEYQDMMAKRDKAIKENEKGLLGQIKEGVDKAVKKNKQSSKVVDIKTKEKYIKPFDQALKKLYEGKDLTQKELDMINKASKKSLDKYFSGKKPTKPKNGKKK
tara:strand:+ start:69 stop:695 length:627 start_codon:yes stop_codon:yes gene_type:complete